MAVTMYDIIRSKRDGLALSRDEIRVFISGYIRDQIPDYQVAALLMAIYFRGMNAQETADLTEEMVASGDTVDLSSLPGVTVDKHSTGGVGDKTTLVLAPMLTALGFTVAKMSGRGLGHTGGTLDKLESIPGFRTDLPVDRMVTQAREIGLAVVAQTGQLVPADGLLYALRDVTATVDSLPLIASSIMSKKLAAGASAIVLDVKTGSGAFMREPDDAFALARAMVAIARLARRRAVAVVTSMEEPLGLAVGNSLEVAEAIDTLHGNGPADLRELCLALGTALICSLTATRTSEDARRELIAVLDSGRALECFRACVAAQGGNSAVVDDPEGVLKHAPLHYDLVAQHDGFVASIDALTIGEAARDLGAGRQAKGDQLDLSAGIVLQVKVGSPVQRGQVWARLFASEPGRIASAKERLVDVLRVSAERHPSSRFIYGSVAENGTETRTAT